MDTLGHFKRLAPRYDELRPVHPALLQQIARVLEIKPMDRLLDIGCGAGSDLVWFKEHFQIIPSGVDRDEEMCREARAKLGAESVVCSDALSFLENHEDKFDAALLKFSTHHFEELERLFHSLVPVILPDGKFAVVTMLPTDVATYPLTEFFPTLKSLMLKAANHQEQMVAILEHNNQLTDFGSLSVEITTEVLNTLIIKRIQDKYISFLEFVPEIEIKKGVSELQRIISLGSAPRAFSVTGTILHARKK